MNAQRIVPELLVSNLAASLEFWCGLMGFSVLYDRPDERFAYLDLDGAELMLEELGAGREWLTSVMDRPFGRGINFQIKITNISVPVARLRAANWALFMEPEEKWYKAGRVETGQMQFLVQDPDGYLARMVEEIGQRTVNSSGPA